LHTLHLKDPSQIRAWALLMNVPWKKDLELRQVSLCGRSFQCVLKKIRIKTGGMMGREYHTKAPSVKLYFTF
jgi:hypothetical protein